MENNMREEWKPVKGYEDLYEVSSYGQVKNSNGRIKKQTINKKGYAMVHLWKNGKEKTCRVHRLVAQAFIPNPNNLPEINHKSEIKTQNNVENLEWCTSEYNHTYGTRNARVAAKLKNHPNISKAVQALDPKTLEVVMEFPSAHEAQRQGFRQNTITECCLGKHHTHKGYIWRYA